jgi:hypothetical protein
MWKRTKKNGIVIVLLKLKIHSMSMRQKDQKISVRKYLLYARTANSKHLILVK